MAGLFFYARCNAIAAERKAPFAHFQTDHLHKGFAMPAIPDDQASSNGSGNNGSGTMRDEEGLSLSEGAGSAGASRRTRSRGEEEDLNLDSDDGDQGDEGEQMSRWCGEIGDYVAANPLKAVAISFVTGWVASRVLW